VPEKFLPLALVRILATKPGFNIIAKVLNNLNPFSDSDQFDRYVKFIKTGKLGSQQKIFEQCRIFYPENTRFVILPMDMAFMGAGRVPRAYEEQIKELADLKKAEPQVIPFLHVDPRREKILDLLKKAVEHWGFRGVKLYPPLGYFPYDENLYPVYEYCQNQNIPVIAHCSPYNPVHFKGSDNELHQLLSKSKTPINVKGKKRKHLCSYFTNPQNYRYVLNDFKSLRISMAHFGSEYYWNEYIHNPGQSDNWFFIIKNMLVEYENFFADISFTLNNQEYFPLLKVLMSNEKIRNKILFGSDYYMVETKTDERRFSLDLRAFIGEDYFKSIAVTNAERFLGG